ncbi:MAG: glycosyltransferase family 2 protein, partial [Atopobiaceae bacterium]|nr:glycosyltransferase family 2 protein [Atopobiaceae bacterium]
MQEQDLPEIQNKRDTSIQLSIIVPVYNAEQYLDECVNSILSQSYQNIELILVDDGSQDSSPQMCDEYSENDCRVIVIHQPNAGTSAARNSGIAHATGEYITFVDNDDFLMTGDCIKKLMERVDSERPDVLMHMNRVFNSATGEFLPSRDTKLV